GRSVQRALDTSVARSAAKTPRLAELVHQEQESTRQLGAIHELLVTASDQSAGSQVVAELRSLIATLQDVRLTLRDQILREFPAYAQLVNPPPVTLEQIQRSLRPSEALIATLVAEDRTFVWAVRAQGRGAFAVPPIGRRSLETTVGRLRQALDVRATKLGDIPTFDVRAAHELFRALLDPVRGAWESAEMLMIVSDGPLAQLPFAVLPMRPTELGPEFAPLFSTYRTVPWLGRRAAISPLPSAQRVRAPHLRRVRRSLLQRGASAGGDRRRRDWPGRRRFSRGRNPLASNPTARRDPITACRGDDEQTRHATSVARYRRRDQEHRAGHARGPSDGRFPRGGGERMDGQDYRPPSLSRRCVCDARASAR